MDQMKYNKPALFAPVGNGLEMHYNREKGGGDPLILLHGGGQGAGGWTNWKTNLKPLAAAGYDVVAPDAIGYGLSSKPEDGDFDFDSLVAAFSRFVDEMGYEKISLVGNSMGGAMSLRYAQLNPDRINKLSIMGSAGLGTMDGVYKNMPAIKLLLDLGQRMKGGITREGLAEFLRFLAYDPAEVTDEMLDERFEIAKTQPARVFSTISIPDLRGDMEAIRHIPMFIFWGRDDKAAPVSTGLDLMDSFDKCRMLIFSECGHWVQQEHSAEFNRACLQFLEQ